MGSGCFRLANKWKFDMFYLSEPRGVVLLEFCPKIISLDLRTPLNCDTLLTQNQVILWQQNIKPCSNIILNLSPNSWKYLKTTELGIVLVLVTWFQVWPGNLQKWKISFLHYFFKSKFEVKFRSMKLARTLMLKNILTQFPGMIWKQNYTKLC